MSEAIDRMWEMQQPGTLLRSRWGNNYGRLALVLERPYSGPKTSNGYPPRQYIKMQWCATGEVFEEMLVNVNNCYDIV